jgi:NTE family protein
MPGKTKIAIACQGGGSQTAFTAGALKALFEAGIKDEFEIVSISGTSGGAVCASLVWFALEKDEDPVCERLLAFWHDNTAQGWLEETFNRMVVNSVRRVSGGLLPSFQMSPSSPLLQAAVGMATLGHRPNFRDFRTLLNAHIDFNEVDAWGPRSKRPVLMIGAANVTTGKMTKFISNRMPIRIEHILASCAVPSIFPAVEIDGDAYWDGLFSDNPPVQELIKPQSVGAENIPDEIWLIKINATGCDTVPVLADDITDRRNELDGNLSLFQQLRHVEMLNDLLLQGAYRPAFLRQLAVTAPIKIPKSFPSDDDKPYHIPCIEMSDALSKTLNYESKLDRSAANIGRLISEGEISAKNFLQRRAAAVTDPRWTQQADRSEPAS